MTEPTTPLHIPTTMEPAEIGPYLRGLREHFKLAPHDVSARIHIRVRYITAIEEGRLDLLPTLVYARGYVHNYADFLGLDADQVVAQWFDGPVSPMTATNAAQPKRKKKSATRYYWRGLAIGGVSAILGLVIYTQLVHVREQEPATVAVAPVPESLLASVRDMAMPTSHNYECFAQRGRLACLFAHDAWRMLKKSGAPLPFIPAIDVDSVVLVPDGASAAAPVEKKSPERKPLSTPAPTEEHDE